MDDVRRRFNRLDAIRAPELWEEIALRGAVPTEQPRSVDPAALRGRAVALALMTAALVVGLLAGALAVGSGLVRLPLVAPPSVSVPSPTSPRTPSPTPAASTALRGGRFIPAGSLVEARSRHAAALLEDGRVLVVGGDGAHEPHGSNFLASTELWDPAAGAFRASASLGESPMGGQSRVEPRLLPLLDGRVLIVPGDCVCRPMPQLVVQIWEAEPAVTSTPLRVARFGFTATLLTDGRVLIAGGNGGFARPSTDTAEVWDPGPGTVAASGPMSQGRYGAVSVLLADGRVLVAGGLTALTNGAADADPPQTAELWDPRTSSFSDEPSLEGVGAIGTVGDAFFQGPALALLDDRVLFLNESGGVLWSPDTGAVESAGTFLEPRTGYTATLLRDGRVLLVGGVALGEPSDAETGIRSAEVWDPVSRRFSFAGDLTEPRLGHTTTALPDGRALVVGGYVGGIPFPNSEPTALAEIWEPDDAR